MASPFDGLQARWEGLAPRERTLFLLTGITVVGVALFMIVSSIMGRLDRIETNNQQRRDALMALSRMQAGQASSGTNRVEIPDEPEKLSRYVEDIIKAVGLKSPNYPQTKETAKGPYTEVSFKIQLPGLTIAQLKDFLEKLETKSKLVVVRELHVKRNFREKEKLDLDLVVATFKKTGKPKEESDDS